MFTDRGISGKRADNRPALQRAIKAVSQRRGSALVVYSLSRLARSTRDAIAIAERLAKSGADLVSLSERIDTTSAAGKMVFRMLAVLAEFERDLVSERTTAAWLATSPASSWRRHSMALRSVSTMRGGPTGLRVRGRRALRGWDGGTAFTAWQGGTCRVSAATRSF